MLAQKSLPAPDCKLTRLAVNRCSCILKASSCSTRLARRFFLCATAPLRSTKLPPVSPNAFKVLRSNKCSPKLLITWMPCARATFWN
jgi:hypothetical protein